MDNVELVVQWLATPTVFTAVVAGDYVEARGSFVGPLALQT